MLFLLYINMYNFLYFVFLIFPMIATGLRRSLPIRNTIAIARQVSHQTVHRIRDTYSNSNTYNNFRKCIVGASIITAFAVKAIDETVTDSNVIAAISKHRPDPNEYEKLSFVINDKTFTPENHALHDSLGGPAKVEGHEMYKKRDGSEIMGVIKLGTAINGYPGIVHGGITALLFDDTFGWLFMAMQLPPSVTANLNINYR